MAAVLEDLWCLGAARALMRRAFPERSREPSLRYAVAGPMVRWTRVATFFIATFCLTHALSIGWVLMGGSWGAPSSYAFANALMLCPAAVAFAMQRFVCREPVVEPLAMRFRPSRWFVLAWLLPPAVMLLALGLSVLVPGARYAPDMSGLPPEMASFRQQVASVPVAPLVAMVGLGLVLGPTLNAIGGLGE
jgi:hypothetical protein